MWFAPHTGWDPEQETALCPRLCCKLSEPLFILPESKTETVHAQGRCGEHKEGLYRWWEEKMLSLLKMDLRQWALSYLGTSVKTLSGTGSRRTETTSPSSEGLFSKCAHIPHTL